MLQDPLFWVPFLAPVIAGLFLAGAHALFKLILPLSRRRRALQRDVAILSGLPPGPERGKWAALVQEQATRVRKEQYQVVRRRLTYLVFYIFLASVGGIIYFYSNIYEIYPEIEPLSDDSSWLNISDADQERFQEYAEIQWDYSEIRIWGSGALVAIATISGCLLLPLLTGSWKRFDPQDVDDDDYWKHTVSSSRWRAWRDVFKW